MISGHKTRSVFDRYNIVSEADLAMLAGAAQRIEAGRKLEPQPTMPLEFGHSLVKVEPPDAVDLAVN